MLDILLELGGELIEWVGELFDGGDAVVSAIGGSDMITSAFEIVSSALLIQGAIYVASLTVDSIRSELNNRRELKAKGVLYVVVQDFIYQNGYTETSLAALNAQNQQVGTLKMKTKGNSNIKKGQKIQL